MNNTQVVVKSSTASVPTLWTDINETQAENLNGGGDVLIGFVSAYNFQANGVKGKQYNQVSNYYGYWWY